MIYAVHAVPEGGPRSDSLDDRWTRNIKPAVDDALRQVNRLKPAEDRYAPLRIQPTWAALAALTSQMAQVQGPKSFIWITQGIENGYMQPGHQMHIDTLPLRLFAERLDGKYHKLRVIVARKVVRIQTPQNYYASILPSPN